MKTYHVTRAGRTRAAIILGILAVIFVFTGRKALGLWQGTTAKSTDLYLFNLNMNTVVPAFLLTLVAVASIPVAWYLVVELLTKIEITDGGIGITAPGYRIFYRWDEVSGIDVIEGPQEDSPVKLKVSTQQVALEVAQPEEEQNQAEDVSAFLSEVDQRKNRAERRLAREQRKEQTVQVRERATRGDGQKLKFWMRLLYPQARNPERLLLYPALEDRSSLLVEIRNHLSG
jgi:hypothetical protein